MLIDSPRGAGLGGMAAMPSSQIHHDARVHDTALVMLTRPRSGSSWSSSLLCEELPGVLPLFEFFNVGFPLAHLNIYSPHLNQLVKKELSVQLVAPRLTNATMRHRIEEGSLAALREVSRTQNKLGKVIEQDPMGALQAAANISSSLGRHGNIFLKIMEAPAGRPLLSMLSSSTRVTFLHMRRNVFQAYVSNMKVAACHGNFQNSDVTACRPTLDLYHLGSFLKQWIIQQDQYLEAMGRTAGDPPIFARPRDAHHPAGAVSIAYEDLKGATSQAETVDMLVASLSRAGYPVRDFRGPNGRQNSSSSSTPYAVQDRSSSLQEKISNYDELQEFYRNNFTRDFCPLIQNAMCGTDPMYVLPP